jgi:hypothetical protein
MLHHPSYSLHWEKICKEYNFGYNWIITICFSVPGAWHEAYDCELEQEILFEIIPHVLPADNPQQSETSSHIGMGGNLKCRRDFSGGTKEFLETDVGYSALYSVSRYLFIHYKTFLNLFSVAGGSSNTRINNSYNSPAVLGRLPWQ